MLRNRLPESPPASGERSHKIRSKIRHPLVFSVQPGKTASARVQTHWAAGVPTDELLNRCQRRPVSRGSLMSCGFTSRDSAQVWRPRYPETEFPEISPLKSLPNCNLHKQIKLPSTGQTADPSVSRAKIPVGKLGKRRPAWLRSAKYLSRKYNQGSASNSRLIPLFPASTSKRPSIRYLRFTCILNPMFSQSPMSSQSKSQPAGSAEAGFVLLKLRNYAAAHKKGADAPPGNVIRREQ
jgi:hypothetical protein